MTLTFPSFAPACRSKGNGRWELTEQWSFTINEIIAVVPIGFITDLYSVPWPLSWFIPRDQNDNRPAIIHDWLFATVGLRFTHRDPPRVSLSDSNDALRMAMRVCDLPWRRQFEIREGVRLGSWVAWNRLYRKGHSLENPCMR